MLDVRARRTESINRARVKLELSRATRPALTVAAGLALLGAVIAFTLIRVSPTTLSSTYQVRFAVGDVTAVKAGLNDVRIKGVPVGEIQEIEVNGGDQPVLVAKIERKYGSVYRDAQAQLRPNTALQDMYLDIVDRGSPSAGKASAGDPLPATQTRLPVNVSDVLNVFGPSQRGSMRTLLNDLGNGMADRGRSLRALFVALVPFVQNAGLIAEQLADREPDVRRLIHNTAALTRELGHRQRALRTLVREGGATLGTLGDSSRSLDATLRELPPTLDAVTTSFAATRAVLGDVDGAVRSLGPVADTLPSSLAGLRALSAQLRPALRALGKPVGDLVPFAAAIRPLSSHLKSAVDALQPQTDTIDKVTRDLVLCKNGVIGFFQWNASMSKFGDARGPIPRGNVVLGAQSSGLINDPGEGAPQACSPGKVIGGRVPTAKDKH